MSPVGDVAKKRSLQKTETFKIFKTIMNETAQNLFLSEQKAKELFKAIEDRGLITPGKTESQLSDEIVQVAKTAIYYFSIFIPSLMVGRQTLEELMF